LGAEFLFCSYFTYEIIDCGYYPNLEIVNWVEKKNDFLRQVKIKQKSANSRGISFREIFVTFRKLFS
jgi:hypothetical protein